MNVATLKFGSYILSICQKNIEMYGFDDLFLHMSLLSYLLIARYLCLPPNVTGKVYCFPHCQLIFSFGRRVI